PPLGFVRAKYSWLSAGSQQPNGGLRSTFCGRRPSFCDYSPSRRPKAGRNRGPTYKPPLLELLDCRNQRVGFPAFADSIRLLTDENETDGCDMPPLRPTAIQKLAVRKFVLAA